MGRITLSLRGLMLATALIAAGFAVFGVVSGGILSSALLVIALNPYPLRWQTWEQGATVGWVLGTILAFSDVRVSLPAALLLPIGFLLGWSWVSRLFIGWLKTHAKPGWPSTLTTPAALLIGAVLFVTGWGFSLRFALSERALNACVQRLPAGFHEYVPGRPRRVGLFWAYDVQERGGDVFLTTDWLTHTYGLAYLPNGPRPVGPDEVYVPVRGRWWKFFRWK